MIFIDFLCISLLIYIAVEDIRKMLVSDKILSVLLLLSSVKQIIAAENVRLLLICSFIVTAFFVILYYAVKNFIGGGDVKLIFVLSVWLGYPQIIVALYAAFITGGFFAAGCLLFKRKKTADKIAFAPFLAGGAVFSFFMGHDLYNLWLSVVG